MNTFLLRLRASVGTGYILVYFGEILFWATPDREGMTVGGLLLTWVGYSLFAHVFLAVVGFFRARDGAAVFLAGAVFGWFEEGIVLQTTYGSADGPFPMSIAFTALAWHALLGVGAGWLGLRRAMRAPRWRLAAFVGAGLGVFYGLWAVFWWNEPPPPMKALLDAGNTGLLVGRFTAYAFLTTAVLAAVLVMDRGQDPVRTPPGKVEMGILAALTALYFAGVTVPAAPKALWVMPPLMGVTLWALARNRAAEPADLAGVGSSAPLASWGGTAGRCLFVFLMPAVASLIYAAAAAAGLRLRTNMVVYYVCSALGTGLWLASLVVIFRRTRRKARASGVEAASGREGDRVSGGPGGKG